MEPKHFDFRLCLNPECRLRYPVPRGNRSGERCPMCLSETIVVAESAAEAEGNTQPRRQIHAASLEALLDNVRSALNVGSIYRTAEGHAFRHLYLCGISPTPENTEVRKTALGAEHTVAWSAHRNAVELISTLKQDGCNIWALERTPKAKAIESVSLPDSKGSRVVLVVGNEQAGVDPGILDMADEVLKLEMQGRKQSFNVAVAFAIAAHALTHTKS